MDSFDDLGLAPELVEALAAEGIERPTDLQASAIPVVRRGNNLVVGAGPGAGIMVAVAVPILDRIEAPEGAPAILLLAPTAERCGELADSLARLAAAAGHRAAAASGAWALPERATLLAATPGGAMAWLEGGRLSLEGVRAVIVDGAATLQESGELEAVETILEAVGAETQRVVVALPLTPEIESLAERHLKKAVHVPPRAAQDGSGGGPGRGTVRALVAEDSKDDAVADLCAALLADDARHVMLFTRSEDVAADVGDRLGLRGYLAGPAGSGDAPVWLAVDDMEGRDAMDAADDVVPVSFDVPSGPDALDRRHGGGRGGVVIVQPRELPHLRETARRAGYVVATHPPLKDEVLPGGLGELLDELRAALGDDALDLDAYHVLLEELVREHGGARVAAAAVATLRRRRRRRAAEGPASAPEGTRADERSPAQTGRTVKLFVSLGHRDHVGPGDLVGAITGEAGIPGQSIGRIDIRDTFSLVEVDDAHAQRVIQALNGTTVKGRAVRVDLDRSERRRTAGPGPRRSRGPGGSGRGRA